MNQITKTIMTKNIQAQLDNKPILPIAVIGERGTGKTSSIKNIASELDMGLLNVSIPSKNLEYFSG